MTLKREPSHKIPNPFRDGVVGDAWDADNADVPKIHKAVYDACMAAVHDVRTLDTSGSLIIHGAAGSGKTHLIRRLRMKLTDHLATPSTSQLEQIFAYVRLDTSPRAIARHVRSRVAADLLRRTRSDGVNQFELMVLARVMAVRDSEGDILRWWEYFREERADELEDLLCDVGETCQLSANFVRVLTHLVARRHRLDVAAWLRGESLASSAFEKLGVGVPDDEDPELEALGVLRDFARLAGSHLPLVICLDQVEALQSGLDDKKSLYSFGHLARNLSNSNQNLLLISCMQSSLFSQLDEVLAEYQQSALKTFPSQVLDPLTLDDARQLLAARIRVAREQFGDDEQGDELSPLSLAQVRGWVGPHGTTPRRLLFNAAEAFDACTAGANGSDKRLSEDDGRTQSDSLADWLSQKWDERVEQARRTCDAKDTAEILQNSLPDLVQLVDPQWRVSEQQLPGLECVIENDQQEALVGVALLDNSPQRLPRQLARIAEFFPDSSSLHKLVLLRDERMPIGRTAAKTQSRLRTLETADAVMQWVAPEASEALEAARGLLASAKAGDLSFRGEPVPYRTVIDWLRANLPASLSQTGEVLVLPGAGREISSDLVERLQEFMLEQCVCSIDDASLATGASRGELEAVVQSRNDLFGIVSGASTTLFSAKFSNRALFDQSSE